MVKTATPTHLRIWLLLLILSLLIFSPFVSAHAAKIIAFGDSITFGMKSNSGGYPPRLNYLLNVNKKPVQILNTGVSGETTSKAVARLDVVLNTFPADIILIMEGTNDVWHGIPVETTKENLQKLISKSMAAGVIPLLATLTPSDKAGSQVLIPQTWNPMIEALAEANGIELVDHYRAILPTWPTSNVDGIHPLDLGYQTIANTWFAAVAPMITSSGKLKRGGGACLVATAAFGSPVQRHVKLLREFRDTMLETNFLGKLIVRLYYRYSPPVARFIGQHEFAQKVTRVLLYPLIGLSYFFLKLSIFTQLLLAMLLAVCIAMPRLYFRNRPQRDNVRPA